LLIGFLLRVCGHAVGQKHWREIAVELRVDGGGDRGVGGGVGEVRCAFSTAADIVASYASLDEMTKKAIQNEIIDAPLTKSLSKKLSEKLLGAMATLIRDPESQVGKAKKK
jgi:hypothetical protein